MTFEFFPKTKDQSSKSDNLIEAVLIGDEDSIGHRRTYFKLEEQAQAAGVR